MKILGVKIDSLYLTEVLNRVENFLKDNKSHYIVTPNPEFLVKAHKDNEFKEILNKADLNIPDGVGLIFASLLSGEKIKERVTGVDLMESICEKAAKENWPIFLFGAGSGLAEKTAENLSNKYKGLRVKSIKSIESIDQPSSILFVALGAPKQEKWINNNLKKMPNVKLAIGIGGAFDFISGKVKRAPEFIRATGFEWLWRLILQPWRINRIFNAVIVFPFLVLKEKINI